MQLTGQAADFVLVFGIWVVYFAFHSFSASLGVKRWCAARAPRFMPWYRISFNLVSLLLLLPPAWITYSHIGEPLWQWQGAMAWLSWGLTIAALGAFGVSLGYYDRSEFLGTRQLRYGQAEVEDQGRLRISPFHRYVRHPWYSIGLVLVWCRDMDPATLAASLAITLYVILGSQLEERKLILYHGDRYRRYRKAVPALVPLPWRHLSRTDAAQLEQG